MVYGNGPRGPNPFKKSDLTRAISAALAAGATLQRIEIEPNGKIVLIVSGESALEAPTSAAPLWASNGQKFAAR
jgi:hypothetical protein